MATNSFTEIDYLDEARERATEYFKDKDVFDRYLQLCLSPLIELQTVYKDLMQLRSIDTAVGAQLDIIGYIVGQPREIFNATNTPFFGFDTSPGARTFGESSDPTTGGIWRSFGQPENDARYLSDSEYRRAIKVKILKNTSQCTLDQLLEAVCILYDVPPTPATGVVLVDHATIELYIGRTLNDPSTSPFPGLDEEEIGKRYLPIPMGLNVIFM